MPVPFTDYGTGEMMALFINRTVDSILLFVRLLAIVALYALSWVFAVRMAEGWALAFKVLAFLVTLALITGWAVSVHKRIAFYRLRRTLSHKLRSGEELVLLRQDGTRVTFLCEPDEFIIASDYGDEHLIVAVISSKRIYFERHLHGIEPMFEEINGSTELAGESFSCSSEELTLVGSGMYMANMNAILSNAPIIDRS